MLMNEKEGTKYPQSGGTGENIPFTEQSWEKEWDKGLDTTQVFKKYFCLVECCSKKFRCL